MFVNAGANRSEERLNIDNVYAVLSPLEAFDVKPRKELSEC